MTEPGEGSRARRGALAAAVVAAVALLQVPFAVGADAGTAQATMTVRPGTEPTGGPSERPSGRCWCSTRLRTPRCAGFRRARLKPVNSLVA